MLLPPSGDVGNVEAPLRTPENMGKSLKEMFCWLLFAFCLSAATRRNDREKMWEVK